LVFEKCIWEAQASDSVDKSRFCTSITFLIRLVSTASDRSDHDIVWSRKAQSTTVYTLCTDRHLGEKSTEKSLGSKTLMENDIGSHVFNLIKSMLHA
jgi:hypothetical protein